MDFLPLKIFVWRTRISIAIRRKNFEAVVKKEFLCAEFFPVEEKLHAEILCRQAPIAAFRPYEYLFQLFFLTLANVRLFADPRSISVFQIFGILQF